MEKAVGRSAMGHHYINFDNIGHLANSRHLNQYESNEDLGTPLICDAITEMCLQLFKLFNRNGLRFLLVTIFCALFLLNRAVCKQPSVKFLESPEGKWIIKKSTDKYFDALTSHAIFRETGGKINISTGTLADHIQKFKNYYEESITDFDDNEKNTLQDHVNIAYAILESSYPRLSSMRWNFIRLSDKFTGFPHTLEDYILITPAVFERGEKEITHILIEEQVHVLQRLNPEMFEDVYNEWGFSKADNLHLGNIQIVTNPDCVNCHWVYKTTGNVFILPSSIYVRNPDGTESVAIHLEQVNRKAFKVKLNKIGQPIIYFLGEFQDYTNKFLIHRGKYDPNEIYANLLAEVILYKFCEGYIEKEINLNYSQDLIARRLETYEALFQKHLR